MAGHPKWSEIKRQKGLTKTRHRARQASLRMIARGERPLDRSRVEADGDLLLVTIPELEITTQARLRSEVATMARDCIARASRRKGDLTLAAASTDNTKADA